MRSRRTIGVREIWTPGSAAAAHTINCRRPSSAIASASWAPLLLHGVSGWAASSPDGRSPTPITAVLRSNDCTSRSCARVICSPADRRAGWIGIAAPGRFLLCVQPQTKIGQTNSPRLQGLFAELGCGTPESQCGLSRIPKPIGRTDVPIRRSWRGGLMRASDLTPASSFFSGRAPNRRLFALSGNNPDPLIEFGDNVLRHGGFEKGDMMFAARCEDALPRLPHFLRIGVAWDRDVAEGEAEIAGPHFGKAEPRHGNDLFAIGDTLGAFQLDPQQELAARAERPRIAACHVLLGRQTPYPCGSHFRSAAAGTRP